MSFVGECTQALIRKPSITPRDEGCIELVTDFLAPLGFEFLPIDIMGTRNLYAFRPGKGVNLCFAGHTDVVPPGDVSSWDYPPFEGVIKEGVLFGRGAVDMKGAIGAYLCALKSVIDSGQTGDLGLSLLLTSDEEGDATYGTVKALETLKEKNHKLDYCLVGEPTNPSKLATMAKIGRRGSLNGTITAFGIQGHTAYPREAANPLPFLLEVGNALCNLTLDKGYKNFDPSHLEITSFDVGNPVTNVIPGSGSLKFNIRFNPNHSGKEILEHIQQILLEIQSSKPYLGIKYQLDAKISGEPFLNSAPILEEAISEACFEVMGIEPELSTTGGTSDARFIKDYCPVIEFGLMSDQAHKVNEHVRLTDLENLQKIYEQWIGYFSKLSPAKQEKF
jgi:succinyl-diaminopimelate desuccinylase